MKLTTTTTLPILATLAAVFGTSSMVVMVQANAGTCESLGFSNPDKMPDDAINQCVMNRSCCDGVKFCRCGGESKFICDDDTRGSSAPCVALMKSMNDTTTEDDPDIIVTGKDDIINGVLATASSAAGSSHGVLLATSLVTAMGGIALL